MSSDNPNAPQEAPAGEPAIASAAPAPWGFWATLTWAIVAVAVPTAIVSFYWQRVKMGDLAIESEMYMTASLGAIAVVAIAARLADKNVARYLALTVPSARDALLGFASSLIVLAVYFSIADLLGLRVGGPSSTRFTPLFLLMLVVVTPLSEELVHRGFLYRGWAQSMLGPWGAILLIAAIFTLLHDGGLIKHAVSGLLFGWLRWQTRSTTVPIIAHTTTNLSVLALEAVGIRYDAF